MAASQYSDLTPTPIVTQMAREKALRVTSSVSPHVQVGTVLYPRRSKTGVWWRSRDGLAVVRTSAGIALVLVSGEGCTSLLSARSDARPIKGSGVTLDDYTDYTDSVETEEKEEEVNVRVIICLVSATPIRTPGPEWSGYTWNPRDRSS